MLDDNSVKYTVNSMIYGSIQVAWSTEELGLLINRLTCPGQCRGLYEDRQGLGHHHRWVRHSGVMRIGKNTWIEEKNQNWWFQLSECSSEARWMNSISSRLLRLRLHHHVSAVRAQPYLWHLLGNYVNHVSWCDVLLAFWARIVFLPSTALLFPLFLFFLFLFGSLFLPTLLLQLHILVRHGQTCVWLNTKHFNGTFLITGQIMKIEQEKDSNCDLSSVCQRNKSTGTEILSLTRDFERHSKVNLNNWDVLHTSRFLVHLHRKKMKTGKAVRQDDA